MKRWLWGLLGLLVACAPQVVGTAVPVSTLLATGLVEMGYGNPSLTAVDVCPVRP